MAKVGLDPPSHLEIAPTAPSRTVLTPPDGNVAFGQMSLGTTPAPHVAWACQLFSFLDKATRTAPSQRSASHLAPYARDFAQWLEQYCEFFGPLTTQVRPFALLLDGEIVFQDQQYHGIASRLFHDGIVALTWSAGVTTDEILALMQILLTLAPHDDEDEYDLTVLLWQAGFAHITIDMYDRTPAPAPEVALQREQIVEEIHLQMRQEPLQAVNFYGLRARVEGGEDGESTAHSSRPPAFAGSQIPRKHKQAIQSQLASEEASLALRSNEFFFFTLTQLKEPRELRQLEKWLSPVVDSLMASRAYLALSFLIDDLIDLGQRIQPTLSEGYEALQGRLLEQVSEAEQLAALVQGVQGRGSGSLDESEYQGLLRLFQSLISVRGVALSEQLSAITDDPDMLLALIAREVAS